MIKNKIKKEQKEMKNYVSPVVKTYLFNTQDVVCASLLGIFGLDNGVYWPGSEGGESK